MARVKSALIKLSGKMGGVVYVSSLAYGEHTRAVRGTFTPSTLNNCLQANVNLTGRLNQVAKQVHDPIKQIAAGFKETMLWQEILKRLRSAKTTETAGLLQSLAGLEINSRYRLDRFAQTSRPRVSLQQTELLFEQQLHFHHRGKVKPGAWQCRLVLLLFDKDGNRLDPYHECTTLLTGSNLPQVSSTVTTAAGACYWLSLLQLQACTHGQPSGTRAAQGMQVSGVGEVNGEW